MLWTRANNVHWTSTGYLTRAWQMDEVAREGLTCLALDPKHSRQLASETELLALRPEPNHIE
jgi:hypothetical protein